jgi:hypothetical protein
MNAATLIADASAAFLLLGTLAGYVQRNSTGKTQRIAAASAALLGDGLKLADAIRGETNVNALLITTPTLPPGFTTKIVMPTPTAIPSPPDSSKLPGVASDAPTTKPDLTQP